MDTMATVRYSALINRCIGLACINAPGDLNLLALLDWMRAALISKVSNMAKAANSAQQTAIADEAQKGCGLRC